MKSRKKSRVGLPAHHNSLDAPVIIWQRVNESKDVTQLLHKPKKLPARLVAKLALVWESMWNQYLEEFGFTEQFLTIKEKEIEIAKMKCKYMISGDRSRLVFISIAEAELKELENMSNGGNFYDTKLAIEKHVLGFQLNLHNTSIREFYSYLKHLK